MGQSARLGFAAHQANEFDAILIAHGFEPVHYPTIAIGPPDDPSDLDASIENALEGEYDWLVLTSTNTVDILHERLLVNGFAADALRGIQVAAIGAKTAEAASELLHLEVDLLPETFTSDHLIEVLAEMDGIRKATIWLPQSVLAKPDLADSLRHIGREVIAVDAYQNTLATGGDPIRPQLDTIDAITFTSGSTAPNFIKRLHMEGGDISELDGIVIACIGPKAAKVAMQEGLDVHVIPDEHTLEGMVVALRGYFAER
ncbi:MAG: uroporphyrinogen-III synthase [Chloroflexi bacterium]|nr:uroporphyrinogen-III synthase [Chloroflexota bacterium]